MRYVITGSSGLIGSSLTDMLIADGHDVTSLVRREPRSPNERSWDPANGDLDPEAIAIADAVVHLAGAGIGDHRWSDDYKKTILDSRVLGTGLIARTIAQLDRKPVLISSSAIGYYGGTADRHITEEAPPGDDFLASVCVAWEAATGAASDAGARVVVIRTGIVLDDDGGALGKLLLPFKLGVGGRLGSGDQWWSWVSLVDQVRAIQHLVESSSLSGPVNVTAPQPVTNAKFVKALGKAMGRPSLIPTPRFALNALLGKELASALLFTSARVLPARLQSDGFEFLHNDLASALEATLGD